MCRAGCIQMTGDRRRREWAPGLSHPLGVSVGDSVRDRCRDREQSCRCSEGRSGIDFQGEEGADQRPEYPGSHGE
jgi:hypothetical protein